MDDSELPLDPISALEEWVRSGGVSPQPMTLATATPDGRPSARLVLLRGLDERGLVFFTNRSSRKGRELAENARGALVLHWPELGRQVRVEGDVEEISETESTAYWATRPRESRLAAWASPQSQSIVDRSELDARYDEAVARFPDDEIPLPGYWGGYRVVPHSIEFWSHRENRLHDRIRYSREGGSWRRERLAP